MTASVPDPPEEVPDEVLRTLEGSSDRQLREIIHYAQHLLRDHAPLTEAIDERDGENLVRIDEHGAYKTVVVERPNATGEARGPFAYHVQWEPAIDGDGGRYNWRYLGRFDADPGGE
ncbi:hypothetical protein BRC81_08390 [Halobacteriales archaeon QS_1_68_20]|nr:MAG: hypothetical protein BRC81_08390 [Halobacteriales archaeon QS_1_68_20]